MNFSIVPTESYIELHFPSAGSLRIKPLQCCRGITFRGKRPIGFLWHNTKLIEITPELIDWCLNMFLPMFDKNAFMEEFESDRCLLPFHVEQVQ